MITSVDDLYWMSSDVTADLSTGIFYPVYQHDEVPTPALRTYAPGDRLQTLAILYGAGAETLVRSEIETQTILYKDGKELVRFKGIYEKEHQQIVDDGIVHCLQRINCIGSRT